MAQVVSREEVAERIDELVELVRDLAAHRSEALGTELDAVIQIGDREGEQGDIVVLAAKAMLEQMADTERHASPAN
jgi:hypothetical protein